MKHLLRLLILCAALFNSGCLPPPVSDGKPHTDTPPEVMLRHGDTLTYSVEFNNIEEKNRFIEAFRNFIDSHHFSGLSYDSTTTLVTIRVLPVNTPVQPESITTVQRMSFSEDVIQATTDSGNAHISSSGLTNDTTAGVPVPDNVDTLQPIKGGVIRLYTHRATLDQTLLELVTPALPAIFSDSGFCTISDITPRKITLTINDKIINGRTKTISTLDMIQQWTAYIKRFPAEGLALFTGVEGIMDFITGREALIRGFNAVDQKTVQIKFDTPQESASTRLKTSLLFVPSLHLGPYYEASSGTEMVLLADTTKDIQKAHLDKVAIKTGGDPNPVLSFSLNKYDALVMNTLNDINYARTTLLNRAVLHKLPSDRYFISINMQDSLSRHSLASKINPEQLLNSYLKVEGEQIGAVASAVAVPSTMSPTSHRVAATGGTLKILYRQDDGISKSIAEKLLADFSNAGTLSTLSGKDVTGYERALVTNDYHIAIGWTAESVLTNENEQLRLASMWFRNNTDENLRVAEFWEIPLFSINTYLCTRKNVYLHNGKVSEMYLRNE
jgi:hypothetical protein